MTNKEFNSFKKSLEELKIKLAAKKQNAQKSYIDALVTLQDTFKKNGNVEYKINGMVTGRGVFLYAETATNAYYYEKMPLSYVAYGVKDSIPNTNVNMFVGFILDDNGKIKMTSGYTKEYQSRLSDWKKSNLTIYNTLRDGKDMSEYPIPYVEEVNTLNLIEFGVLR